NFDSPVTMHSAQLDAVAEIAIGAGHAALRIGGVAEAAERTGLQLVGTNAPGVIERPRMLGSASFDAAERKIEIAAKMMNPGEIEIALPISGHRLGSIEHHQRLVIPVGDAHAARKPDLRLAALDIVGSRP